MPYKTDDIAVRRCLECGDEIPYGGRVDKLYCSNSCRSRHNYTEHRASLLGRARIINALSRNYSILARLLKKREDSALLSELTYAGFVPEYMTSCRRKLRYNECACFDIRYNIDAARVFSVKKMSMRREK